ncbi:MAG TPA: cation diffusion facilitator family transporter [Polyangiaceae bacterium]|nr:cation diffusion facilitator family transporter [Polyangiaceae bacterium]
MLVTLLGSGVLSVMLLSAYIAYDSQLAFAQFADSLLDVVTAAVLGWTVRLSAKPEDSNHHFGHRRAQPVGALVAAVLTGVLAAEVIQRAIAALLDASTADFDPLILWIFGAKVAFKGAIWLGATRLASAIQPAMKALAIDARNDMLTSGVAIAGFVAARYGATQLDAWLALPLAILIAWSGFRLAVDNVRLLMGEAPPEARQQEIVALAQSLAGVRGRSALRAHYVGTEMHVHIEIQVDPALSVGEAHDIGEAVRLRLEAEPDISRCSVHIDPQPR